VSPPPKRQTKNLTADDLEEALFALCKIAEIESFKQEYKDLQASRALSSKSQLLPLRMDSFIMALRGFCGRGNPKTMRSDNGTNFVGVKEHERT